MLMKGLEKLDIFLAIVRGFVVHACFAKSLFLFFFSFFKISQLPHNQFAYTILVLIREWKELKDSL